MQGLMMADQLRVAGILEHAAKWHADTEIVSRLPEGGVHRYTYAAAHGRSRQLANALLKLGIENGDRVGTLAYRGENGEVRIGYKPVALKGYTRAFEPKPRVY